MKVFLSWSGELSHRVAIILRDWLPSVIQSIQPYVSSEDIDKGTRWSTDIAKELNESKYGIIVVTKENINAPWINFESGALSKTVDKAFVCPFLVNVKRSEINGPLLQFQSTIFEKDDVRKLLEGMNESCGAEKLEILRLSRAFETWWPQLHKDLDSIVKEADRHAGTQASPQEKKEHKQEILEEMLELLRSQYKVIRNPEELLPPAYFRQIIERSSRSIEVEEREMFRDHPVWIDLEVGMLKLRELSTLLKSTESKMDPGIINEKIIDAIHGIHGPYRYIREIMGISDKMLNRGRRLKSVDMDRK